MRIGIMTFVTDQGIGPAALGKALEQRGFDSLFMAEHSHIPASRETPYPGGGELPSIYYHSLDPFVALTAAAAATERLLVGTGVALLPQRDTIHTAKEVATVDLVSGGRFLFGVGVGWNREEMRNHGTDPKTRGRRADEQLAAMRKIWTEDEAEFHGEFVDFDPVWAWPKPVQQPHPPIYIGGGDSKAVFDRIVKAGAGWFPNGGPDPSVLKAQITALREHAGREVPITAGSATISPEALDAYAEWGTVERALLFLPTMPAAETEKWLDEYADFVPRYA